MSLSLNDPPRIALVCRVQAHLLLWWWWQASLFVLCSTGHVYDLTEIFPTYPEIKISILLMEEVKLNEANPNHLPHGQASK